MVMPKLKKTAPSWSLKGAFIALIGTVIIFSVFDVDVDNGSSTSLGLDVPRGQNESALIAPIDKTRKTTIIKHNKVPGIRKKDVAGQAPLETLARNGTVPVIAYAISLVKCGDHQSSTAGLIDAALVLQHSVHMQSIRNPASGSKYDYQMYAFVHVDAVECSHVLKTVGM